MGIKSIFSRLASLPLNRQLAAAFALLFAVNLISWVIFYPGYYQGDHQQSIALIAVDRPSQWHSLLWGYLAYPFLYLSPAYSLYGLVQIAFFCFAVVFSLWRLYRVGFIKSILPLTLLFALFPSYLFYNLLYSSDMCFAYCLIPLTALLIELVSNGGKSLGSVKFLICFGGWLALACCLRKNAVIALLIISVCLIAIYHKRIKNILLMLLCVVVAFSCVDVGLRIAVGATPSPSGEMLSVPTTQIACVYYEAANGGEVDIPDEVNAGLTQVKTAEEWANSYQDYSADNAKSGTSLTPEFLKNWLLLGIHNPEIYIKAYMSLEYPFWIFGATSLGNDLSTFSNGSATDFGDWGKAMTLENVRYSPEQLADSYTEQFVGEKSSVWLIPGAYYWKVNLYHIPFLTELTDYVLMNRALPFWTLLIGFFISLRKRRAKQFLMIAAPVAGVVLGLLLSAPIALMRYAMEVYYALPLLILWIIYCAKEVHPEVQTSRLPITKDV